VGYARDRPCPSDQQRHVVIAMDAFERAARISQLERENAESLLELEQRQAERDPARDLEEMIAEHRGSPLVRREGDTGVLIHRTNWNALVTPPQAEPAPSDASPAITAKVFSEAVGEIIVTLRREWHDEIEALRREWQRDRSDRAIRDATIVERSARIAQLQKENAESHAQLNRQQLDRSFAERDARFERIETKLSMLMKFLSLSVDLPRGFPGE